jgi:hypothetical protein
MGLLDLRALPILGMTRPFEACPREVPRAIALASCGGRLPPVRGRALRRQGKTRTCSCSLPRCHPGQRHVAQRRDDRGGSHQDQRCGPGGRNADPIRQPERPHSGRRWLGVWGRTVISPHAVPALVSEELRQGPGLCQATCPTALCVGRPKPVAKKDDMSEISRRMQAYRWLILVRPARSLVASLGAPVRGGICYVLECPA